MTKFKKGEIVIYGINGICSVEDVSSPSFGKDKLYYTLKPVSRGGSTLYVPVDNEALTSKIRYVLTREQIDALLEGARGKVLEWDTDKNARANNFKTILYGDDHSDLILMIRCIYLRQREQNELGKKISSADEAVLKSAEKLIVDEFAYSLSIEPDTVGDYIRSKLGVVSA